MLSKSSNGYCAFLIERGKKAGLVDLGGTAGEINWLDLSPIWFSF